MATKDHRRELRLSSNADALITEAAGLLGLSVSEFLLGRAVTDAEAIVDAHRTVRLQQDSYERFLMALDAPLDEYPVVVERDYDVSGHYPPDLPGCGAVLRGPGVTVAY